MPKLSKAAMAEKRQAILNSAAKCFRKRGFHATTIQDICREARVSTGAVYTHFETKQQIIDQLGKDTLDDLSNSLAGVASTENAAALLGQLLRKLLTTKQGLSDAELDLNLWAESIGDPLLRRTCQRTFRTLEQGFLSLVRGQRGEQERFEKGIAQILHAAAIGFEVQRALGMGKDLAAIELALTHILSSTRLDNGA